ncbi:MAG TPA: TetR family transcriptional regulator [Streptosporangiaceae bacterium]|jgi:AcrR family transcriptional regulator
MARPGRRPGPTETREAILTAARELFGERGYDGATIRAIAGQAGVDPALVHHFFGNKEQVFVAAMAVPFNPAEAIPRVLEGPQEEFGERLVRFFLSVWDAPDSRSAFLGLVRSAMTNDQAAAMFREFLRQALLGRVAATLGVSPLRAEAAMSHMIGVVLLRYVLRVEPLATLDEEELVRLIAPSIQRYLAGP